MTEMLIVFVTCESSSQAEEVARKIVEEQLAACVNVVPGVRSCYAWEGKLTWSEELLLIIKTTRSNFESLKQRVSELHSYDVPEIIGTSVDLVSEKYWNWVRANVKKLT
jgi:periplasmic divalent cation tolerance protein